MGVDGDVSRGGVLPVAAHEAAAVTNARFHNVRGRKVDVRTFSVQIHGARNALLRQRAESSASMAIQV